MVVSEICERSFNPNEQGETPDQFATVDPQLRPILLRVQHEAIPALGERPFLPLTVSVLSDTLGTNPFFNSSIIDFNKHKKILFTENGTLKKGLQENHIYALSVVMHILSSRDFSIGQNINWKGNYGERGIIGEAIALLGEEQSIINALSDPYPLTQEEKLADQKKYLVDVPTEDHGELTVVKAPVQPLPPSEVIFNTKKSSPTIHIGSSEILSAGSEAAREVIRQLREERAEGKIPIQEIPGYVDSQQQTIDGIKQGDPFRDGAWNFGTCERLEIVDGRQYVTVLFANSGLTARFQASAIERGRYVRLSKRGRE